jgi:phosphate transport system substrate-binding protein
MKTMRMSMILAVLLVMGAVPPARAQDRAYKIGVLFWRQTQDHEDGIAGFVAGMNASGVQYTLDIRRAYEDEAKIRGFLHEWNTDKVDLILTFGTKGARWAMSETKGIPIVAIGCVADPVKYGIAESLEKPGKGVTGTLNWVKPEEKLAVFERCVPAMKRLGVIYDCCDIITVTEVEAVKGVCGPAGITLKQADVKDVNGIEAAVRWLMADGIDALWVPTQTFIYQHMANVAAVTRPAKLPVLASTLMALGDEGGSKDAAILAVTVDLKDLGRLSVPAAVEILTTGKSAGEIPFRTLPSHLVVVNSVAAREIGYQVPPLLLSQADTVLKGYAGQHITVAGTGDCQQLLRTMAASLTEQLGEGEIVVPESVGSSGGIRALARGEADLARVARPLKKSEREMGLECSVFGRAPVVFVANPSVKGVSNLTSQQIADIYSGKITNWRELGGPDGKVYPVTREAGDSCLSVLCEKMPAFAAIDKPVAKTFYTAPQTLAAIVEHAGAVGYLPAAVTSGTSLKVFSIDGIEPSQENVRSGKYAMSLPLGIVHKDRPHGLAARFIDFLYSEEGVSITRSMGVVPETQMPGDKDVKRY